MDFALASPLGGLLGWPINAMIDSQVTFGGLWMRCHRVLLIVPGIAWGLLVHCAPVSLAQERPTILAGHGTLSGSILPLWVGAEAKAIREAWAAGQTDLLTARGGPARSA